jgi:hypothetical protein
MSGPFFTNGDGSVIQRMASTSHAITALKTIRKTTPGLIIDALDKYDDCMWGEKGRIATSEDREIRRWAKAVGAFLQ